MLTAAAPEKEYNFDRVCGPNISQKEMFDLVGRPSVDRCLQGYNSSIIAYGQSRSGKTFTMLGDYNANVSRGEEGLIPRVMVQLFEQLHAKQASSELVKWQVRCSFLELYRENVRDLLDATVLDATDRQDHTLRIREDSRRGTYVENLIERSVDTISEARELLVAGMRMRATQPTHGNDRSSSSHTIFTITIRASSAHCTQLSQLNLVDLGDSESQHILRTGTGEERLEGGSKFNQSLLTLGNVIMALYTNSTRQTSQHVPYRESKLTWLLKGALGGNSKTCIIANVSPSFACGPQTISTLEFVSKAQLVTNRVEANLEKQTLPSQGGGVAGTLVADLRRQICSLKQQLQGYKTNAPETSVIAGSGDKSSMLTQQVKQLQKLLHGAQQQSKLLLAELSGVREKLSHANEEIQQLRAENAQLRLNERIKPAITVKSAISTLRPESARTYSTENHPTTATWRSRSGVAPDTQLTDTFRSPSSSISSIPSSPPCSRAPTESTVSSDSDGPSQGGARNSWSSQTDPSEPSSPVLLTAVQHAPVFTSPFNQLASNLARITSSPLSNPSKTLVESHSSQPDIKAQPMRPAPQQQTTSQEVPSIDLFTPATKDMDSPWGALAAKIDVAGDVSFDFRASHTSSLLPSPRGITSPEILPSFSPTYTYSAENILADQTPGTSIPQLPHSPLHLHSSSVWSPSHDLGSSVPDVSFHNDTLLPNHSTFTEQSSFADLARCLANHQLPSQPPSYHFTPSQQQIMPGEIYRLSLPTEGPNSSSLPKVANPLAALALKLAVTPAMSTSTRKLLTPTMSSSNSSVQLQSLPLASLLNPTNTTSNVLSGKENSDPQSVEHSSLPELMKTLGQGNNLLGTTKPLVSF